MHFWTFVLVEFILLETVQVGDRCMFFVCCSIRNMSTLAVLLIQFMILLWLGMYLDNWNTLCFSQFMLGLGKAWYLFRIWKTEKVIPQRAPYVKWVRGIITMKGLRDPFLISQSYFQRRILLPLLAAAIVLVTLSSPNANWVEKRSAASQLTPSLDWLLHNVNLHEFLV